MGDSGSNGERRNFTTELGNVNAIVLISRQPDPRLVLGTEGQCCSPRSSALTLIERKTPFRLTESDVSHGHGAKIGEFCGRHRV